MVFLSKDSFFFANLIASFPLIILQSPDRTLDAPELIDDYYMKLLDWSTRNVVAITLKNTVYMWNASKGSSSELLTVDEENGPCNECKLGSRWTTYCCGFE